MTYDAENRLTGITGTGVTASSYVYDADGGRVKATVGSTTTITVGKHYEKEGATVRKYYYEGSVRVAMRSGGTLYYLLSDHLGSTSLTTNASGARVTELR